MSRPTASLTPVAITVTLAASLFAAGCGGTAGAKTGTPASGSSATAAPATNASPVDATADAKITDCGTAKLGVPAATVQITNNSGSAAKYTVSVGFFGAGGKHLFDGANLDDEVQAGKSVQFVVVGSPSDPTAKVPSHVTCKLGGAQRTPLTGS